MRFVVMSLAALVALQLHVACLSAGEGGTLKGQFLFDGTAPAPAAVAITADPAFCGKHGVVDESLVIGKDGGIANIVVYMYLSRGETVPIHPAYEARKDEKILLDNEKCRFSPHVALLWTAQTITLGNKDTVAHNTKIDCRENTPVNPILPANASLDQQFKETERLPIGVSCSIHPWMKAWAGHQGSPLHGSHRRRRHVRNQEHSAGRMDVSILAREGGLRPHGDG